MPARLAQAGAATPRATKEAKAPRERRSGGARRRSWIAWVAGAEGVALVIVALAFMYQSRLGAIATGATRAAGGVPTSAATPPPAVVTPAPAPEPRAETQAPAPRVRADIDAGSAADHPSLAPSSASGAAPTTGRSTRPETR
jgi:hypothetical protein